MPAIAIRIIGIEKLTDLAGKFPAIAQKHIDKAIVRSIGEVNRETKPLTPVKTGRLRGSLIPVFRPFRGVYGTNVPYAAAVHDLYSPGTHYKRPSLNQNAVAGFLVVGVKKAERTANKAFKDALDNIVKDLAF